MSIYDQIANAGNSWQFGTSAMKVRQTMDNRKLAQEESARRDSAEKRAVSMEERQLKAAQMASRKEQRDIEAAERAVKEFEDKGADREAGILAEAGAAAVLGFGEDENEGAATAAFFDVIKAYGASDEEMANFRKTYDKDGDGLLGKDEIGRLNAFSQAVANKGKLADEPNVAPNELTKLQARLNDPNTPPGDIPAIKARIAKLTAIVGTTEHDPKGAGDPRTDSQAGAAYQESLDSMNTSSDIQEMIGNALPEIIELPNTVGIRGKLAQGGAGLAAVLGSPAAGENFAEWMAGADSETIAAMQTQLQAIRGRIIPLVTGEQGKRLSEMEREIASRAVGLIDQIQGTADFTKAYPQVIGSLKQLYEESWATQYTTASQDGKIPYPFDLAKKTERLELMAEMNQAGLDENSILRAMTRLRKIQGISSN